LALQTIFSSFPFFIIPFLGGNHLPLSFVTIDRFWIETAFVLSLLVATGFSLLRQKEGPRGFLIFLGFFGFFGLVNLSGALHTWSPFRTAVSLNMLLWAVASVYLFSVSERRDILLKALVLGTGVSVVCMFLQYQYLFPYLATLVRGGRDALILQERVVPFSSFLNESTLGGYFLFVLPVSLYFAVSGRSYVHKIVASVILFGLLFTQSRMGILIGVLSLSVMTVGVVTEKGRRAGLTFAIIALLGLGFFAGATYLAGGKGDERYRGVLENKLIQRTGQEARTLNYRTQIWKGGLRAFAEKPVLGYGPGTFEYPYRKYYDAYLYTRYAHSSLLNTMVELGTIGLVAFALYLFCAVVRLLKGGVSFGNLALLVGAGGGFLFSTMNVALEIPASLVTFFVLTATPFMMDREAREKASRQEIKGGSPVRYLITGSIIVLLLASFFFTERTDLSRKGVEDGAVFEENGPPYEAFRSYADAARAMPLYGEPYLRLATILLKGFEKERDPAKKEEFKKALCTMSKTLEKRQEKDSEMMLLTGLCLDACGQPGKAEDHFLRAIEYYPSSAYYMFEAAVFYLRKGDTDRARAMIRRADPWAARYETTGNLNGFYVYRLSDLEADIEFARGNLKGAREIARANLGDAERERFPITHVKAREYVEKQDFIRHLRQKVFLYESKGP
jgi:O-antigen ligase/tetratricopeptide (TPR) repeat protein